MKAEPAPPMPMAQRAAIEIGAQGQDQADVGAATQRRIGEAGG
jgi:hypothetical protein